MTVLTRMALPVCLGLVVGMLAAGLLGTLLLAAPQAGAQALQAVRTTVTSKDPTGITFSTRVRVPAGVKSARLEYRVLNPTSGAVGGGGEAQLTPGAETDLNFSLGTRDNQRYIPVGSVFQYFWRITPNEGPEVQTESQDYLFIDGRYEWRNVSGGGATVYYYGANENAAQAALLAARAALEETGALLGKRVEYPIRLFVFRSEEEGKLAMRPQSPSFDAQVRTGGQRVAADVLHVFDNVRDPDVIRHEVAHVVTHVAGDGPFTGVPSWLDEGTAVYMQKDPGFGYRTSVNLSIQADRTMLLRAMQSSPGRPEEVDLFYGQSWSTVKFMIDEFGQPKFAQLYATVKDGARVDDALQKVYGFNQDGLYNAWRAKNGLKPIAVTAQPEVVNAPAAQATRPPLGVPGSGGSTAATPEAESKAAGGAAGAASGPSSVAVIAVLAGTIVVAGALGAAGFVLLRRRG